MKKLLIVGEGRAGKDTACEYLSAITGLRNAGTTSRYLCRHVAYDLGLSEEEAFRRRHESDEMRILWYNKGNEVRQQGPTTLIREALENGEITGGIRDLAEIICCREEGLVDLIIWVENLRVRKDPTVMFTSRECDVVIQNNWDLAAFQGRLERFAKFAGLGKCGPYPYVTMTPEIRKMLEDGLWVDGVYEKAKP
jgi:hypothetical protein